MLLPPPDRRRILDSTGLSLAAHAVILGVLVFSLRSRPVHVFNLPGTELGTRLELFLPAREGACSGASSASEDQAPPRDRGAHQTVYDGKDVGAHPNRTPSRRRSLTLTVTESASAAEVSAPASATPDATTGSDSWGSGAMQIALTTYSPSPKPDLSVLPHGVQGDVVVDITIDPNGKVAELAVLRTLGYGIESSVIGTLKTWVFRPSNQGRCAHSQRAGAALPLRAGLI